MDENNHNWDTLFAYLCLVGAMLVLLVFTSCRGTKVLERQESVIDSTYMAIKSHTDSLTSHTSEIKDKEQTNTIIKDSIVYVVDSTGKVITVDRWHYQDRWRDRLVEIHDTMYVKVVMNDSLSMSREYNREKEVIAEKRQPFLERIKGKIQEIWLIVMLEVLGVLIWRNMGYIIKFFKR